MYKTVKVSLSSPRAPLKVAINATLLLLRPPRRPLPSRYGRKGCCWNDLIPRRELNQIDQDANRPLRVISIPANSATPRLLR